MPSRNPQSLTSEVESVLGPAPADYGQPEVVLLRFRRHGRRLVLPVLALVALSSGAGYWVGAFAEGWMNLLAGVGAVVLALLLGVFPVLRWLTYRTTVTTRRVIQRHGVFSRHRSEVSFVRIREVRTRRSLLQRLFGAGDVDLFIGPERTTIPDVPGVSAAADALQELVERNYAHATRVERRMGEFRPTSNVAFTNLEA
ncbi:PH domain-containing protein [Leucobacter sp. USHLN154]|uniref:PH domain-containing protein n=1 Tax=Leucobacter sp. USHLN154 TaxID=3081269 RepID=UPI0030194DB2